MGGTRRKSNVSYSTRRRHPESDSLPANATRTGRESYFSGEGEVAEEGRALSEEEKRWDDRTDRMTFEVRKGDTTVSSVWTNSVRNAFRKQAGWAKLQEARTAAAKHWTESVWYRHNQRWLQASKDGTEAAKRGSFTARVESMSNGTCMRERKRIAVKGRTRKSSRLSWCCSWLSLVYLSCQ